jgi:hypothetical protein
VALALRVISLAAAATPLAAATLPRGYGWTLLMPWLAAPLLLASAYVNGTRALSLGRARRVTVGKGSIVGKELAILAGSFLAMFVAWLTSALTGLGHL